MNVIAVVVTGNHAQIAGVGLGTVTLNMLCISVLIGTNSAQVTFVSQAYGMKEF